MMEKLAFIFCAQNNRATLYLSTSTLTVLVEPNNKGESIVLREIGLFFNDGNPGAKSFLWPLTNQRGI